MKARITIEGELVQDVGYRLFLLRSAKGLDGFEADNIGEGIVVLVEGGEKEASDFIKFAEEERPTFARVSSIRVEEYDGRVMRINEFRNQFNVEQLAKIASTGVEMTADVKEIKGDIKEMKGDVKEMKGDIKEMKGDVKTMLVKQDETVREIREFRIDLQSWMEERFTRLETDVKTIKQKIGLA